MTAAATSTPSERWPVRNPSPEVEQPPIGEPRTCDDCGEPSRALWHQGEGDPDGPMRPLRFCSACLHSVAPSVLSRASRASTWRPRPEETSAARAEIAPSTPELQPRPAVAPAPPRRELWAIVTNEVAR